MPRFKPYNYDQSRFIAIDYRRQILPGTFEYAIDRLINERVDMKGFASSYKNDLRGAPAYDPALLLKVICLLQGHHLQPRDRGVVPHERDLHRAKRRCVSATVEF